MLQEMRNRNKEPGSISPPRAMLPLKGSLSSTNSSIVVNNHGVKIRLVDLVLSCYIPLLWGQEENIQRVGFTKFMI